MRSGVLPECTTLPPSTGGRIGQISARAPAHRSPASLNSDARHKSANCRPAAAGGTSSTSTVQCRCGSTATAAVVVSVAPSDALPASCGSVALNVAVPSSGGSAVSGGGSAYSGGGGGGGGMAAHGSTT